MTDKNGPTRLAVIEGDNAPKRHRKPVQTPDGRASSYECAKCTGEVGYSFSALSQMRIGGCDVDGKLRGGALWWGCPRCFRLAYKIRDL